jgi:hypothetical protein
MAKDIGVNVGLQTTALGIGVGAVLWTGHAQAMDRVRAGHQANVDAQEAAKLQAERLNHVQLAALARSLARRLADSEAKNARLETALLQRQAYIDRQRAAA